MGLDVYFYKVKKNTLDVENLTNTYKEMIYANYKKLLKGVNSRASKYYKANTIEDKTIEAKKLLSYVDKNVAYNFHTMRLRKDIDNDKLTDASIDSVNKSLFGNNGNLKPSPIHSFYARKEWWIPEYVWEENNDTEGNWLSLIKRKDLNYMIKQYEIAIEEKDTAILGFKNMVYDYDCERWLKSQLKDLKRLHKSLKDDEIVLGVFSY